MTDFRPGDCVVKIYVPATANRFLWNIDGNVGVSSPNKKEDVELVQFGYFAMSQVLKSNAKVKAIAAAVVPGAGYSGAANDPLTLAILAHQQARGGTQDKHVSPVHGAVESYNAPDGPHTFMLTALMNNMSVLMPDDFPRIDKHPRCPAELKKVIRKLMVG